MATIQTKGLTYRYGIGTPFEKTAVDHVDLEIESGSFVGIIGHTGSGKSTLIQHLNGLLKPTEGSILLDGKDIWAEKAQMRQVRFRVGLVFQYPEYQIFEETVAKDIAFGPRNMGLAEEEVQARVKETAAIVGLSDDILEQSPFLLSGGQKRRVARHDPYHTASSPLFFPVWFYFLPCCFLHDIHLKETSEQAQGLHFPEVRTSDSYSEPPVLPLL